MLGHRESQGDFFRPDHVFRDHVGEKTFYGLLARWGADWFRDEDFVALYHEDFGRPSLARTVTVISPGIEILAQDTTGFERISALTTSLQYSQMEFRKKGDQAEFFLNSERK